MKHVLTCLLATALLQPLVAVDGPDQGISLPVVDFGSDIGIGWYRNGGAYKHRIATDLDGDGEQDDCIMGWPWSLEEPLSPPGFEYDNAAPSARFYGGAEGRVLNHMLVFSEGHINQDHEYRDDWNLMLLTRNYKETGYPEGMQFACTAAWIWRKQDFLGGGADHRVSFEEGDWLGLQISRYWGGLDWGRFVIIDDEGAWISERSYGEERGDKADRDHGLEAGSHPIARAPQTVEPGATRWTRWQPEPDAMQVDLATADWQQRRFGDVQAVGFIVQRAMRPPVQTSSSLHLGEPLAFKWHAFHARATVHRPQRSADLVEVSPDGERLVMRRPVSFREWRQVRRRAVSNQRLTGVEAPGYSFIRNGSMAGQDSADGGCSIDDRAAGIAWLDALAWCNALSEAEGREPCYYTDEACGDILREAVERNDPTTRGSSPQAIHWKRGADGFRLPTPAEWRNDGHVEGSWEWVWADGEAGLMGGASVPTSWPSPGDTRPWYGAPAIGLRVVAGPAPESDGEATWVVDTETTVAGSVTVDPDALAETLRTELRMIAAAGAGSYADSWLGFGDKSNAQDRTAMSETYDIAIAGDLVSYACWSAVRDWAITRGYRFDRLGDVGSAYLLLPGERRLQGDEPVTMIGWQDAAIWCNAASELLGLEPVYHDAQGDIMRAATRFRLVNWQQPGYARKLLGDFDIFVAATANGLRLPSPAEWKAVLGDEKAQAEAGWRFAQSGGITRGVRDGEPDGRGFRDLAGNVTTWGATPGRVDMFGLPLCGSSVASINTQLHFIWTMMKDHPTSARPFIGLRPVRRLP